MHAAVNLYNVIVLCCGHTCAVKQRAAKNNTWNPMGTFCSALLDAVKQQLLKSSCSNVTKMTMFANTVDVFHIFFKAVSSRLAVYAADTLAL